MKPTTPHDPLDDLIAAALHGELTPEERTQFDARLRNEPATQAAYQKAQAMHDLLEKTHKSVQPDASFEQRMVSGVRRKIQHDQHPESAWESLLVLWTSVKRFMPRRYKMQYAIGLAFISAVSVSVLLSMSNQTTKVFSTISSQLAYVSDGAVRAKAGAINEDAGSAPQDRNRYSAFQRSTDSSSLRVQDLQKQISAKEARQEPEFDKNTKDLKKVIEEQGINYVETAQKGITLSGYVDTRYTEQFAGKGQYTGGLTTISSGNLVSTARPPLPGNPAGAVTIAGAMVPAAPSTQFAVSDANANPVPPSTPPAAPISQTTPQGGTIRGKAFSVADSDNDGFQKNKAQWDAQGLKDMDQAKKEQLGMNDELKQKQTQLQSLLGPQVTTQNGQEKSIDAIKESDTPNATQKPVILATDAPVAPAIDTRKLIRNAQLDLEVKSYQAAVDQITALTKADGGYVDTSNSQKGGNGKLQGTIVVKVLPQNLDSFLIKLRDLGLLRNQSVSTDDVTKDYFDTIARLDNSRRMEAQLQDLLKRTNGKVADLLQVERELGRVRGEIEQMQGQLKLYDFQVQFATVTMNMRETDLNQAAAYLLKENDNFALFATDVEGTFQQTRKAADDFKAHILNADLNHNSGSDVSATLIVSVPPDQIEAFLSQLRTMGRVANFTRQTQRVAKDGGDTDQPADQTLTDKDKVIVNITIRSDDESRKQVAMTVVTSTVDDTLEQAKTAALGISGEILNSSLNKSPQGQSTGQLTIRVPGKSYHALLDTYRTLGRTASFSLQRDDNSGPGVNGDDAPVIVSLSLTDEETPLQQTAMSVLATDVDNQAQQLKKDAPTYGAQIKSSSFEREPNGMEVALMTFRLPMSKYAAFVDNLKKIGHVEALTVARVDRPDQARTDDTAPVEISFRLHNQGDIVASDDGFMATLRQTFGEGAGALFNSIRVIGVLVAFSVPWLFAIVLLAWIGRRIYIWKKK